MTSYRNCRVKEIGFLCLIDRTTLLIVHAIHPAFVASTGYFKWVDEHPYRTEDQPKGNGAQLWKARVDLVANHPRRLGSLPDIQDRRIARGGIKVQRNVQTDVLRLRPGILSSGASVSKVSIKICRRKTSRRLPCHSLKRITEGAFRFIAQRESNRGDRFFPCNQALGS
jgi:hypothetical protein